MTEKMRTSSFLQSTTCLKFTPLKASFRYPATILPLLKRALTLADISLSRARLKWMMTPTVKITLTEGKYHQIKRMLEAVDNKIIYLERIAFGGIELDPSLERGQWRYLTNDELNILI